MQALTVRTVSSAALARKRSTLLTLAAPLLEWLRRRQTHLLFLLPPLVLVVWRAISAYARRQRRVSLLSRAPLDAFDPVLGDRCIVYRRWGGGGEELPEWWEELLDGMGFDRRSPLRAHIRQLLHREEIDAQLRSLFDVLLRGQGRSANVDRRPGAEDASTSVPRLLKEDAARFSAGVGGHLRVLLRGNTRVPIVKAAPEDRLWLAEEFDKFFPPSTPLDREIFPAFAKLVLLRRVVRTLIGKVGLERIKSGMDVPFVVDLAVDLGHIGATSANGSTLFRLHTVAPSSSPGMTGERLALIQESQTPASP